MRYGGAPGDVPCSGTCGALPRPDVQDTEHRRVCPHIDNRYGPMTIEAYWFSLSIPSVKFSQAASNRSEEKMRAKSQANQPSGTNILFMIYVCGVRLVTKYRPPCMSLYSQEAPFVSGRLPERRVRLHTPGNKRAWTPSQQADTRAPALARS